MSLASTFRASFSPLRLRNFRIYLGGQAISLIGTWLQMTAQSWVVWEISKSTAALGVVTMLGSLPVLLLGPWVGSLADRLDRRRLLIGTQIAAMLLAFALALLTQSGLIEIWHLYVLSTLLGVVSSVEMTTQQAFIGDLAGMGEVQKAVNLNAMILQVSRILGPALAGLIVGLLGAATAFWINGLSFLAVIASLAAVTSRQARPAGGAGARGGFVASLRYIRSQPRIQDLLVFVVLVTFLVMPTMTVMPAVASDVLGGDATTLGWLMAASGAGALTGTLFLVPLAQALRRTGVVVGLATIWAGTWAVIFSFTTWLPLAIACMFAVSLGIPIVMTMAMGLLQILAPAEMRARLLGIFVMITFGTQPLSSLLIGFTGATLGPQLAIRLNGIVLLAGALLTLGVRPKLRNWEARPAPAAVEAA